MLGTGARNGNSNANPREEFRHSMLECHSWVSGIGTLNAFLNRNVSIHIDERKAFLNMNVPFLLKNA